MTVLVCTDFSAASATGEREAANRFPDASLIVFHCCDARLVRHLAERTGSDQKELRDQVLGYADQRLNEIVERMGSQGRRALAELVEGDPVERALEAAAKHGAELIVVGAPAENPVGRFRTLLARKTTVPVLLIPSAE